MISIFGATGLVGTLTAEYLHTLGVSKLCLAGRNREKLEALRNRLNPAWEIALADAKSPETLLEFVKESRVVIATAGPYQLYGNELVDLCARLGVDYVDLCGEIPFIRRSIDLNTEKARNSGARIVHSCGFDSVPSDMGMLNLFRAANSPFSRVDMVVEDLVGGISLGTVESARQVSYQASAHPELARLLANRYSLNPDPHAPETHTEHQKDFLCQQLPGIGWVGPFFMAAFNTRVVRRSNALLDHAWGPDLRYREGWLTGTGLRGRMSAILTGVVTKATFSGARNKVTRPLVERLLPKPGSVEGHFKISHYGRTVDGQLWRGCVSAAGDPGYEVTAKMLGQAALTLVDNTGSGGVLTPSTGLGPTYLDRLSAAGLHFSAQRL